MLLMDKIAQLRRANGWSQEELAEKLDVTRQSVSKWESGQSVPDLERILRMSELFGVSTDALLKDEEPVAVLAAEDAEPLRRIGYAEAKKFLAVREQNAPKIAWGVAVCILSFLPLMLLGTLQEAGHIAMSEDVAAGIGLCAMLLMLTCAVAVFVMCGMRSAMYEYMEKDEFIAETEVVRLVKEKREEMRAKYARNNTLAVCLCILSLLPLFVCICFKVQDWLLVCGIGAMLVMIAVAVMLFIRVGVPWDGFNMLLQEGDYARSKKRRSKSWVGSVSTIYWLVVTAAYLLISFLSPYGWGETWMIWPIAGVLYGALTVVLGMIKKKD